MDSLLELLRQPWPWYVAGPLIGLLVPALLVIGNRPFGVSANLRHLCAMLPTRADFFRYDWRRSGLWNLTFAAGIVLGAALATFLLPSGLPVQLDAGFQAQLESYGLLTPLTESTAPGFALVPEALFRWSALSTLGGWLTLVVGSFLVGFGARYAGGCTSGHAITGLADRQLASLVAVLGFFAGGLLASRWLLPWALGGGFTP
ncbi:MAG: YeeE/YedE thiosulfate transporter family protein [Acidobacteriota bacterium]